MTRKLPRKAVLCLWIFLSLTLSSCSWSKREQIQGQIDHAAGQAQMEFEAGRFQRAIDIYEELHQKYPQDPAVQSGYIRTLESIRSSGDRAFERNDFETAQNIYEILARNWPRFADLGPSLSFNKSLIGKKAKASTCLFVREQVSSHLKAGEIQGAIDLSKNTIKNILRIPVCEAAISKHWKQLRSTEIGPLKEAISPWLDRSMNYC